MAAGSDRVLVVGQLAGARHGDGWFAPADVAELFETLRVPPPVRIDNELGRLRAKELLVRRKGKPPWSLTPQGREQVKALLANVDTAAVLADLYRLAGTEFGHTLHTVIPPSLAPVKWQEPIQRMLVEYHFDTNVFCMTRFPRDAQDTEYLDPVADVMPVAREVLRAHGLTLHVASDRQLDDDLYGNIAAHMWACRYGIGLFEDRLERGLNHNMVIEVGSMVITGRRCALLKDETIEKLPTDFSGQLYKPVDFADTKTVADTLHRWAADDLGLGRCPSCPPAPHMLDVRPEAAGPLSRRLSWTERKA
jgi:hypothetical protein